LEGGLVTFQFHGWIFVIITAILVHNEIIYKLNNFWPALSKYQYYPPCEQSKLVPNFIKKKIRPKFWISLSWTSNVWNRLSTDLGQKVNLGFPQPFCSAKAKRRKKFKTNLDALKHEVLFLSFLWPFFVWRMKVQIKLRVFFSSKQFFSCFTLFLYAQKTTQQKRDCYLGVFGGFPVVQRQLI
jgi:hypothetical protein